MFSYFRLCILIVYGLWSTGDYLFHTPCICMFPYSRLCLLIVYVLLAPVSWCCKRICARPVETPEDNPATSRVSSTTEEHLYTEPAPRAKVR